MKQAVIKNIKFVDNDNEYQKVIYSYETRDAHISNILPDVSCSGPIHYEVISIYKGCFWLPVRLIPKAPHENTLDSFMTINYMYSCSSNYVSVRKYLSFNFFMIYIYSSSW